jgi:D-xylose transport system permease protein
MSDADPATQGRAARRGLADTLELGKRLFGMILAFAVLCVLFQFMTDGKFLSARNIFNISVQTVSVGIMATGMVFVIVSRHIDLSVDS